MLIQDISASALAVHIDTSELMLMGIKKTDLSDKDTSKILEYVLKASHKPVCKHICFEVFPGRHELLIFIRLNCSDPVYFSFSSFEDLLSSISLVDPQPSSLYFSDGKYILSLFPWDGENLPPVLFEFGEELHAGTGFDLHLREHGKTIIISDAIERLKTSFLSKNNSKM